MRAVWDAFADENYTENLGKDFEHQDIVSLDYWARYFFKGIFPNDTSYLRLRIINPSTDRLVKSFYFKFTKSYSMSLDGQFYIKDPVLGDKIVRDGVMEELVPVYVHKGTGKKVTAFDVDAGNYIDATGKVTSEPVAGSEQLSTETCYLKYVRGYSRFAQVKVRAGVIGQVFDLVAEKKLLEDPKQQALKDKEIDALVDSNGMESVPENVIRQMSVAYTEKAKMIFLVTPIWIIVPTIIRMWWAFRVNFITQRCVYDLIHIC